MKEREKRTNVKAARSAHVKTEQSFLLGVACHVVTQGAPA